MLTAEQNELLTRIGPGTPAGNLMRRYWHPIAAASELTGNTWNKRVRLFGEDLVLFKDREGRLGLITEQCPHRRASLAYGIPTKDGIRCPYHGWEFARSGECLSQPNEPDKSSFRHKVKTPAYAVEEMGGLFWAYLGPAETKPLLPRIDGFVAEGAIRMLGRAVVPCNWLQIMENSLDPIHTEWLHGHTYEFVKEQQGKSHKVAISAHHEKIAFREFDAASPSTGCWPASRRITTTGRSATRSCFRTSCRSAPATRDQLALLRVPDPRAGGRHHTLHLWYTAYVPPKGNKVAPHLLDKVYTYDVPYRDENGDFIMDNVDAQDIMAWITQGTIADRTRKISAHPTTASRCTAESCAAKSRRSRKVSTRCSPSAIRRRTSASTCRTRPTSTTTVTGRGAGSCGSMPRIRRSPRT